ncbi:hypothetical protein VTK73DRAFT_7735 [Phialemonium thermophilum]|uniref:Uncharacterized protein n=1 Tax=Phialemonium thermophilum TaxID=223376 RepID=A0ABR3WD20_9PEZI
MNIVRRVAQTLVPSGCASVSISVFNGSPDIHHHRDGIIDRHNQRGATGVVFVTIGPIDPSGSGMGLTLALTVSW